jgi:hypothetical protein
MNVAAQKFAIVFGLCAIIVSLCSGCATRSVVTADLYDLNYFQPDCRLKAQQIAFLQSLRPARDQLSIDNVTGFNRQVNWTINSHLNYLAQYC